MATVKDLLPGDLVTLGGRRAVLLVSCDHPVWSGVLLTVWRMKDDDSVMVAAMDPRDTGPDPEPIESAARADRLMAELITAGEAMRFGAGLRRREV
ncbi:MAG TPA: hypothetical protein VGQ05_00950 [Streptosporangiaceae bacterium]|nr:hypothetical protein [Streptosporangiaceae bacterium]